MATPDFAVDLTMSANRHIAALAAYVAELEQRPDPRKDATAPQLFSLALLREGSWVPFAVAGKYVLREACGTTFVVRLRDDGAEGHWIPLARVYELRPVDAPETESPT